MRAIASQPRPPAKINKHHRKMKAGKQVMAHRCLFQEQVPFLPPWHLWEGGDPSSGATSVGERVFQSLGAGRAIRFLSFSDPFSSFSGSFRISPTKSLSQTFGGSANGQPRKTGVAKAAPEPHEPHFTPILRSGLRLMGRRAELVEVHVRLLSGGFAKGEKWGGSEPRCVAYPPCHICHEHGT